MSDSYTYVDPVLAYDGLLGASEDWNDLADDVREIRFPDYCILTRTTVQTIANNTLTALSFNSNVAISKAGMHSTSSNPTRIIAVVEGLYQVNWNVEFASNATGYRAVQLRLNGAGNPLMRVKIDSALGGAFDDALVGGYLWKAAAADYLEIMVQQTSGGNLDVQTTSNYTPNVSCIFLGAF